MRPLRVLAPEPAPEPRPLRKPRERGRLLRALRAGLFLQALLTLSALLLTSFSGAWLRRLGEPALLAALLPDLLGPSWLAGLFVGFLSPRLRWWHLASAGLAAAGVFLLASSVPSVWAALPWAR